MSLVRGVPRPKSPADFRPFASPHATDELVAHLHRYEATEGCTACPVTGQGVEGMGESGYEAYLVPKRGEYIRRSLGGMPARNSASLCTGTVTSTLCPVCRRASQLHAGSYLCISAPKSWVGRAAAPKICRSSWHAAGLEPGLAHASHDLPSPPACTPAPCRSAPVNMKEMTRSTVAESIPLSHQHASTPPTQRTP